MIKPELAKEILQSEWNAHCILIDRAVSAFKDWPCVTTKNVVEMELEACLDAITRANMLWGR